MHKKGDSSLEKIIISAFYLILAVITYFIINNVVSEKSFFEDYSVRELGLTIDTLHISPGNLKIEYKDLDGINFKVKENSIEVKSLDKNIPKIYLFTKDKNYNELNYNFAFTNNILQIVKEQNKINLISTEQIESSKDAESSKRG